MSKKLNNNHKFDVIVIGSGIAGSSAALLAAQAGQSVALVEKSSLGGASANYSDVPISVFARATQIFEQAKRASQIGLRAETISYNFPSIKLFKDQAIQNSQVTTLNFYESHKVKVLLGAAHFIDSQTISVNSEHYQAQKFVIAGGADWQVPKISGLDQVNYFTPDTLINIPRPPRSLFIIGGDKAGIESAQIMASFGTKVHIATISARLLPDYDEEIGDFVEHNLSDRYGVLVSTSSRVNSIQADRAGWRVHFNHAGIDKEVVVEQILLANGKTANTDLGLENAKVDYDHDGIKVNAYLQTSNKNIYASGAVINTKHDASHIAIYESRILINNMLRLSKATPVDYQLMPRLIKTTPQIAQIGLSEDDCNRQSIDHHTAIANLKEAPYGLIAADESGFVKIITDRKRQIIGATVVSEQAEILIHELALIIRQGLNSRQVLELPHSFLSLNELILIACEKLA